MPKTSLRKVGGSIMMAVPPAILDELDLKAGAAVSLAVRDGRIIVEPQQRARYTLQAVLAEHEPMADESEDREWLDSAPVGRELL